jgi:hypothetical protein
MNKQLKKSLKTAASGKKNLFDGQSDSKKDPEKLPFAINFKHVHHDNGQHHSNWEQEKLLSQVIDKFKHYCDKSLGSLFDEQFKAYHCWPPKSNFIKPKRFPDCDQKNWASMHINGRPCVIGYMVENVFYMTWFDKEHEFWLSTIKNT